MYYYFSAPVLTYGMCNYKVSRFIKSFYGTDRVGIYNIKTGEINNKYIAGESGIFGLRSNYIIFTFDSKDGSDPKWRNNLHKSYDDFCKLYSTYANYDKDPDDFDDMISCVKMDNDLFMKIVKRTNIKTDGIDHYIGLVDVVSSDDKFTIIRPICSAERYILDTAVFRILFKRVSDDNKYTVTYSKLSAIYPSPSFPKWSDISVGYKSDGYYTSYRVYKIRGINKKITIKNDNENKYALLNVDGVILIYEMSEDLYVPESDMEVYVDPVEYEIIDPLKLPGEASQETDGGFFESTIINVDVGR